MKSLKNIVEGRKEKGREKGKEEGRKENRFFFYLRHLISNIKSNETQTCQPWLSHLAPHVVLLSKKFLIFLK